MQLGMLPGMAKNGDPDHPVARAIRAARKYAGLSREQLGEAIGVGPATIGRYERGEWEREGPRQAALEGIGRATGIHEMLDVFGEPDSEQRFLRATRREAERHYKRPESDPEEPASGDDPGEGQ